MELDLTYLDKNNIHMTIKEYMSMMLDVIRSATSYKDVHTSKFPLDCWIFKEIIYERKPTIIVEIGNQAGGSTLMFRDYLMTSNIVGAKYVIAIDISRERLSPLVKNTPNIKLITGDALDDQIISRVNELISPYDKVMVIDDSSHEYQETLGILFKYSSFVTKNQYFIVEDTLYGEFVPFGEDRKRAYDAVKDFLRHDDSFKVDRTREKYFLTLNPGGYLEKIR